MKVATASFGNQNLAFASVKYEEYSEFSELLAGVELHVADGFASQKRKTEFFAGRIAAKLALAELQCDKTVTVLDSDAGAPIVSNEKFAVSISHSGDTAVALAFGSDCSFGVDIQIIRTKSMNALKHVVTEAFVPNDVKRLTVAWTMKEALSKCLKTGFTLPYEEFLLADFIEKTNRFECTFAKYPQYSGQAAIQDNYALAVIGSRDCMATVEIQNLI